MVTYNSLDSQPNRRGIRVITLLSSAGAAARVLMEAVAPPLNELRSQMLEGRAPVGGWTLDRLVVDASAGGLVVAVTALALLLLLNVAAACLGSALAPLDALAAGITPASVRRLAFALCGVAMTAPAVGGAATADDSGPFPPLRGACAPSVTGLPLPDLPSSPRATMIAVHYGDSLWSIAESELPAQAPSSAVAAQAALLYTANRRIIGTDPDLILPGQRLDAPGGAS
jgi:hypothetical protein